ncbi:hypothetical protein SAMN05192583_1858 [Sphingomonas gellani]|uniref:Secreted protein n=1 Tax=Sphingomonas gellani TaxID=1166340 RepID=A0A1H8DCQ8_9SPHN|nr:hypothetical protein [Sphingomonas gellani]SEN04368.1 hypothetical protein SAMN05192583_1858 [Sphingomonas gellani]
MKILHAPSIASSLVLALAACSSGSEAPRSETVANTTTDLTVPADTSNSAVANAAVAPAGTASDATANTAEPATPTNPKVLALEGLGTLRIGQAVPGNSSWKERGAQESEGCRTVSSPDYPGVYAIVTEGKVRRITVGKRSDVQLAEGIGVGTPEAQVKKWFAGFREEPHKYEDAPAKYLSAPNAASGDPALRFEIGRDGKVSLMHVGTAPVLEYVEGCS